MKKLPLITVVVPVYQVKKYLNECVDSLLVQTYTNLEILLVDDGSTDGSETVCDEYATKDARVRVIHQENQGPSAARNAGIDQARGKYIAFVDSDDVALPDFIKVLYGLLEKYQADIAACAYIACGVDDLANIKEAVSHKGAPKGASAVENNNGMQNSSKESRRNNKEICMTSEQMLRQWHGRYKKWETVAWNKLYRKQIFDGGEAGVVRFPVGRKLEDVLTSHLMAANAKQIVLTKRKLYLYRIRPDSRAKQSRMGELMSENLRAQRERMVFFKEKRYWRAYLNLWVGYVLHWGWFKWRK